MPKKTATATATDEVKETAAQKKKREAAEAKAAADAKKAADAKAAAAEQKRAAREKLAEEQWNYVEAHYLDGDESLSAVASHLSITSGKTAFIAMQIRVDRGEVPKIVGKDDETLLKNIHAARAKADEYSSWGWLAARSGKSEGFIKNGLEEAGLYEPRAENIATKRAESKPAPAPAGKTTGKKTGAKAKGNA
jgi:hypothetical protein